MKRLKIDEKDVQEELGLNRTSKNKKTYMKNNGKMMQTG